MALGDADSLGVGGDGASSPTISRIHSLQVCVVRGEVWGRGMAWYKQKQSWEAELNSSKIPGPYLRGALKAPLSHPLSHGLPVAGPGAQRLAALPQWQGGGWPWGSGTSHWKEGEEQLVLPYSVSRPCPHRSLEPSRPQSWKK